ncbi:glutamate receptor ionotropic, kainate 2 isoform X2 [Patella vulgata]|nr:glutamate receptor ionotropic, kainate 2 isoform X2 [Patella vulgata]
MVLFAVEKWNPFYEKHPNTPVQNFSGVFWYLYGAMLTQGGERLPESLAGRKFISFWWLFCIMLVAIYSGNLMAFLTIARVNVPFDTLAGMVDQDEYKWGTLGGSAYTDLFNNATTEIYTQIGNGLARFRKTDSDVISSVLDVHKTKLTQEKYAYVGDMMALQSFMKANNCSLHIIKEKFLPLYYSVALPMNSSLQDIISKEIIRITESGLLTMWMNKWLRNGRCLDATGALELLEDMESEFDDTDNDPDYKTSDSDGDDTSDDQFFTTKKSSAHNKARDDVHDDQDNTQDGGQQDNTHDNGQQGNTHDDGQQDNTQDDGQQDNTQDDGQQDNTQDGGQDNTHDNGKKRQYTR